METAVAAPVKYDVKNTKEVLVLLFSGAKTCKQAKENDGKFDFSDAPLFLALIPKIGPAVGDISLIPKEMGDLDSTELTELTSLVAAELGEVVSTELMAKIEKGLKLVHAGYEFFKVL